jgi:hypothetical protein
MGRWPMRSYENHFVLWGGHSCGSLLPAGLFVALEDNSRPEGGAG